MNESTRNLMQAACSARQRTDSGVSEAGRSETREELADALVAAQGQRGVVPVLRARLAAGALLCSHCLLFTRWHMSQNMFWRVGMSLRSSSAAQLEEKRIPYTIEKINMRCYGDKPPEYTRKARAAATCRPVDACRALGCPGVQLRSCPGALLSCCPRV